MSDLTTPTDQNVTQGISREDIYYGSYQEEEAPDIVVDQADGIHIQGGLGRDEVFTQPEEDGWRGENKRNALFVASGPDFETGAVENLSILDLAPTMLHLHGCAIPSDMDGEVAMSVLESGSPANEREVTQFQVGSNETLSAESAEESAVQERLEDLGYL